MLRQCLRQGLSHGRMVKMKRLKLEWIRIKWKQTVYFKSRGHFSSKGPSQTDTAATHMSIVKWYKIGLLLCHSHIELRLWLQLSWGWGYLNMRLKWGWDEIESKFSWTWVEVELSWSWDKLTLNKGRNWAFIGVGLWFKICFRSTYVAEQHLLSMLLLILSNLRVISFWLFGGKK